MSSMVPRMSSAYVAEHALGVAWASVDHDLGGVELEPDGGELGSEPVVQVAPQPAPLLLLRADQPPA